MRSANLGTLVKHGSDVTADLLDQQVRHTSNGCNDNGLVVEDDDLGVQACLSKQDYRVQFAHSPP